MRVHNFRNLLYFEQKPYKFEYKLYISSNDYTRIYQILNQAIGKENYMFTYPFNSNHDLCKEIVWFLHEKDRQLAQILLVDAVFSVD